MGYENAFLGTVEVLIPELRLYSNSTLFRFILVTISVDTLK